MESAKNVIFLHDSLISLALVFFNLFYVYLIIVNNENKEPIPSGGFLTSTPSRSPVSSSHVILSPSLFNTPLLTSSPTTAFESVLETPPNNGFSSSASHFGKGSKYHG